MQTYSAHGEEMFKNIIGFAILMSLCSAVEASEDLVKTESQFKIDTIYDTRVLTDKEMIYIEENQGEKSNTIEKYARPKITFQEWEEILKKR